MTKRKKAAAKPAEHRKRSRPSNSVAIKIKAPTIQYSSLNCLLGLPPELRCIIFTLAFRGRLSKGDLAPLLTCRQIYHEAHSLVYDAITLMLYSPWWISSVVSRYPVSQFKTFTPTLRHNVGAVRFSDYRNLRDMIRGGWIAPHTLICTSSTDTLQDVKQIVYDYGCIPNRAKVELIRHELIIRKAQNAVYNTWTSLSEDQTWRKKCTTGVLKRYTELTVGALGEDAQRPSYTISATRLDGSSFKFRMSCADQYGI
jgi:hypothetical protein